MSFDEKNVDKIQKILDLLKKDIEKSAQGY